MQTKLCVVLKSLNKCVLVTEYPLLWFHWNYKVTWKVLYTYKTGIFQVQLIVPIKWLLEFTFDHYLTSAWKVSLPLDFEGARFLFLNVCYFVDNMHEQFGEAPREVFWSCAATARHSWGSLFVCWARSSWHFHNLILQEERKKNWCTNEVLWGLQDFPEKAHLWVTQGLSGTFNSPFAQNSRSCFVPAGGSIASQRPWQATRQVT